MMDEKDNVPAEDLPELIFFDTDDIPEEADFIRVDDLFRMETDSSPVKDDLFTFVLFPRKKETYISSRMALLIRRTLILSSVRLEVPLERIRVRPMFAQWQSVLTGEGLSEMIVRGVRTDLETQASLLRDAEEDSRFWAGSCFVYPAGKEYPDDYLNRLIGMYQEE